MNLNTHTLEYIRTSYTHSQLQRTISFDVSYKSLSNFIEFFPFSPSSFSPLSLSVVLHRFFQLDELLLMQFKSNPLASHFQSEDKRTLMKIKLMS